GHLPASENILLGGGQETPPSPPADIAGEAPREPVDEMAPDAENAPSPDETPGTPVALPPVTVNPALAATGETPAPARAEQAPPKRRTRPAARKKAPPAPA